jgi:hypothetical protein
MNLHKDTLHRQQRIETTHLSSQIEEAKESKI